MRKAKINMLTAMGIFGSVGIFVNYIPLPSAAIAFCRGLMGMVFLLLVMAVTRKRFSPSAIKDRLLILSISGVALGANWILLFEAYRYTTVATATVCYYLAPMLFVLFSPLLGEKLTPKKILCVGLSLCGLILVSNVLESGFSGLTGVFFGLGAAALYATIMFLNKKLTSVPAYDKTVFQLGTSAVVLIPYLLLTGDFSVPTLEGYQWALLVIVGIVHTGVAYWLYFGSIEKLHPQTISVFSYLDPVVAILLSALLLREPMSIANICGSLLILGSALYSELPSVKERI